MTRFIVIATALLLNCQVFSASRGGAGEGQSPPPKRAAKDKAYPWIGQVERLDPALDQVLAPSAVIEKLASGFRWSEGPVWVRSGGFLLLSDVPNNVIFRWDPGIGTRVFLEPSGYTGNDPSLKGEGSNGLALDPHGNLVLCQQGNRQIARLAKNKEFVPVARYYHYRRFNSPNDLVYKSNGDLYFTDPTYGMPKGNNDPAKELTYSGVFRVTPKGEVILLTSNLSYPNGLAFSPDERILYIAVSDPEHPAILAYQVDESGNISDPNLFFDPKPLLAQGRKGLPDGLKVDQSGNVWATGPGGVLIISPEGKHLGTIETGEVTGNCAFGGKDGSMLYMTANSVLCRIQTLTRGATFPK